MSSETLETVVVAVLVILVAVVIYNSFADVLVGLLNHALTTPLPK